MDLPGITDKWLKNAGDIQHVVIFGIESHVCVLQTTLDLLDRGIQVHVIKDGVSSCNVGEIDVALEVSFCSSHLQAPLTKPAHSDRLVLPLHLHNRECAIRVPRSPPPSRSYSRCSVSTSILAICANPFSELFRLTTTIWLSLFLLVSLVAVDASHPKFKAISSLIVSVVSDLKIEIRAK